MSVRIRLQRGGTHKRPFYRLVATDIRNKRDGRNNEVLGVYNPLTVPKTIDFDLDRIDYWVGNGALPSETAVKLIDKVRAGQDGQEFITVATLEASRKDERKKRQEAALNAKPYEAPKPAPAAAPAEAAPAEEATEAPAEA